MSRIVRVYDAKRDPPEWNRLLNGTEVAVSTEDAASGLPAGDAEGPTCEIFGDIKTAEVYCKNLVAEDSTLRCMVFDSKGRGGDPLAVSENRKTRSNELTGAFRRWSSAAMITAARRPDMDRLAIGF